MLQPRGRNRNQMWPRRAPGEPEARGPHKPHDRIQLLAPAASGGRAGLGGRGASCWLPLRREVHSQQPARRGRHPSLPRPGGPSTLDPPTVSMSAPTLAQRPGQQQVALLSSTEPGAPAEVGVKPPPASPGGLCSRPNHQSQCRAAGSHRRLPILTFSSSGDPNCPQPQPRQLQGTQKAGLPCPPSPSRNSHPWQI